MNLTSLTTALHKWADKHGGQFPDAMLCNEATQAHWTLEAETRFGPLQPHDLTVLGLHHFKGVIIYPFLSEDDSRVLFACTPSD